MFWLRQQSTSLSFRARSLLAQTVMRQLSQRTSFPAALAAIIRTNFFISYRNFPTTECDSWGSPRITSTRSTVGFRRYLLYLACIQAKHAVRRRPRDTGFFSLTMLVSLEKSEHYEEHWPPFLSICPYSFQACVVSCVGIFWNTLIFSTMRAAS